MKRRRSRGSSSSAAQQCFDWTQRYSTNHYIDCTHACSAWLALQTIVAMLPKCLALRSALRAPCAHLCAALFPMGRGMASDAIDRSAGPSFAQLVGGKPDIVSRLKLLNVHQPNAVQQQAIPLIRGGKDVVLHAPTGCGKTVAFLLPLLEHVNPRRAETQVHRAQRVQYYGTPIPCLTHMGGGAGAHSHPHARAGGASDQRAPGAHRPWPSQPEGECDSRAQGKLTGQSPSLHDALHDTACHAQLVGSGVGHSFSYSQNVLKAGPHVIVATPQVMNRLVKEKQFNMYQVRCVLCLWQRRWPLANVDVGRDGAGTWCWTRWTTCWHSKTVHAD